MKARPIIKRDKNRLPMPSNHREVLDDEELKEGDYIYSCYKNDRWMINQLVFGWAGKTPRQIRTRGLYNSRFSTPILK